MPVVRLVQSTAATLLLAAFATGASAQPCTPFTDVSAQDAFCGNIQWMHNRGITLGCTATTYCPSQAVSRLQMAAFMNRLGDVVFQQGGNAFGAPGVIGTTDAQPLDVRVNGGRVMRYDRSFGSPSLIGGYAANSVTSGVEGATIGGGGGTGSLALENPPNRVFSDFGTVGGGAGNTAGNTVGSGGNATVGGGQGNSARGRVSTIAGGYSGFAPGDFSFIGGGRGNNATGTDGVVGGGLRNEASGLASAVPGGQDNEASGDFSFAFGQRAFANQARCIVFNTWSSGETADCLGRPNSFHLFGENGLSIDFESRVGASGNGTKWVHIGNQITGRVISANSGAHLTAAGVWTSVSDAASKEDFAPVDAGALLTQVASLPIRSWRYKSETRDIRHVGPTSQDFRAAFGLGDSDTTIGMIDADGVALAAIQGLNAKVDAQAREIETMRASHAAEIAALRQALERVLARER